MIPAKPREAGEDVAGDDIIDINSIHRIKGSSKNLFHQMKEEKEI